MKIKLFYFIAMREKAITCVKILNDVNYYNKRLFMCAKKYCNVEYERKRLTSKPVRYFVNTHHN